MSHATAHGLRNRVLVAELLGFGAVAICLWLDEILDLPHLLLGLGPGSTPINWPESLVESAIVLVLGGFVLALTRRLFSHISYLEELVVVCSSCKRVRIDETWVPMEEYLLQRDSTECTHGLCMDCLERLYGAKLRRKHAPALAQGR